MRTPGLVDLQVNGFAGVDFNSGTITASELDRALEAMLATGVTTCLPTLITAHPQELETRFAALDRAVGVDLVSTLSPPLWDTSWLLDDMAGPGGFVSAMTGYRARPELASVLVYALYWLAAAALLPLPRRTRVATSAP